MASELAYSKQTKNNNSYFPQLALDTLDLMQPTSPKQKI